MLSIKPRCLDLSMILSKEKYGRNEELGTICVFSIISHRQHPRTRVLQFKRFIGKLLPIDTFSSHSVSLRDIASLDHKVGNNAVEDAVLVAQIFSSGSLSLLTSAQAAEVLSGLGNNIVEKLAFRKPPKSSPRRQFVPQAFHQC